MLHAELRDLLMFMIILKTGAGKKREIWIWTNLYQYRPLPLVHILSLKGVTIATQTSSAP